MRLVVLFLGLMMVFSHYLFSQEEETPYTYQLEKRYNIIHELDGEVFVPAKYQFQQEAGQEIEAGAMKIELYGSKVLIKGVEQLGLGSFHILSKMPNKLGYLYELMDENGQPARLKIFTDKKKYINIIYFFSKNLGEHTFFLAKKRKDDEEKERRHFTNKEQYFVRNYSNLISKTVVPYQYVTPDMEQPKKIAIEENSQFVFNKTEVVTPEGTFVLKKSKTMTQKIKGYPAVRSLIEIWFKSKKGQPKKMFVYVNFKQQIELLEVGNKRYLLMP